ncbi:MAG: DUF3471 domain-containing protein [Candidatus Neomarinimicrobiota bacterium]
MINANGTSPGRYFQGINAILNKVKNSEKEEENDETDLEQYVGYYDTMPWWGEVYISTWGDQLVSIDLPARKPADAMYFYEHVEGDVFRRVRDDDELGETMIFERDENDEITKFISHGYYSEKINR